MIISGEWIMPKIIWNKKLLAEKSGSYWETCTLHTGVKLGIFTVLEKKQLDLATVAKTINGDPWGVENLLNALSAMGLLDKKEGLYANTDFSLKYLTKDSSDYMGFIIMHHHHLMDSWNRMSESVLSGKPCRERPSVSSDVQRESFLMGMYNNAIDIAPRFAQEIDLSGRKNFLDFGGGPGTYAIHFCMANPDMKATVFDLPSTRGFAEKTIAKFGLSDRIDFKEGSYTDESINLEKKYDVAWISHNLHGESPEQSEKVVAHAISALKPGGLVFIHEFILDNDKSGPLFSTLFSINMLLGTPGGRAYSEEELIKILEKNGAANVKRLDLESASISGVVCGTV